MSQPRQGSILLVVAGLAVLLLALAVALFVNLRTNVESATIVQQDAQARIMLHAALHYLQESSRLGWATTPGEEAAGWTDQRGGARLGPLIMRHGSTDRRGTAPSGVALAAGNPFPAEGGVMRGDAFCWRLPPYAMTRHLRIRRSSCDLICRPRRSQSNAMVASRAVIPDLAICRERQCLIHAKCARSTRPAAGAKDVA